MHAVGPPGPHLPFLLGTCWPDGRPHAAGMGPTRHQGDLDFTSSPGTRKSHNVAANPACTISTRLEGIDVVVEGTGTRVTDGPALEQVAGLHRFGGCVRPIEDQHALVKID